MSLHHRAIPFRRSARRSYPMPALFTSLLFFRSTLPVHAEPFRCCSRHINSLHSLSTANDAGLNYAVASHYNPNLAFPSPFVALPRLADACRCFASTCRCLSLLYRALLCHCLPMLNGAIPLLYISKVSYSVAIRHYRR